MADFRVSEQDFVVDEVLGFALAEEGEHFYLQLQKTGTNTQWLAKQLALYAGVKPVDVGYSGLKDRHAVTSQWFSIYLPKIKNLCWNAFLTEHGKNVTLLNSSKHTRKLKRGMHESNNFLLTLRNFKVDKQSLDQRLEAIKNQGVPNYFGEQRFGIEANNLVMAQDWLVNGKRLARPQKGFVMSAARSYVFNLVVAARVRSGSWDSLIDGDAATDAELPSGPLWGRGRSSCSGQALAIEQQACEQVKGWLEGLEHCGLNQERRSLVLKPKNLSWQLAENNLQLSFSLPPGEFATAILREVAELKNCSVKPSAS